MAYGKTQQKQCSLTTANAVGSEQEKITISPASSGLAYLRAMPSGSMTRGHLGVLKVSIAASMKAG